jgi:peptidyl-prolyl cis-trans isomerase D
MQIIQSIREKGAAILIGVIALSLISFILMDAQQGGSKLFGSLSSTVGKVNGEEIELSDFNKRVKEVEDIQAQRSGQRPSGNQTYQMRQNMWDQIIGEKLIFSEAKKLGINFTSKELSYILLSNNQSNPFLQEPSLKDSITGQLDIKKAQQALGNIKKMKGEQKDAVNTQIVDPLVINTTVAKYAGLLNASAYYPSWMQKTETTESSSFSVISYVTIPYSEISDSAVKVTDQDITDYVSKHKEQFKQEPGRNISYVSFSSTPSKEDSAVSFNALTEIKTTFEQDTNAKAFVARNSTNADFNDSYTLKSKLSATVADTLVKTPIGKVFGPYVDKGSYILAKMLNVKDLPDSVKARHILIGVNDPRTGEKINDDSTAKKLADSINAAVLAGADFAALAKQYSTDASNKEKGGDLGTFTYGTMISEFNEFCFTKSAGTKGVVKTDFGYHIVDIISQKDFKPAYKIAFVTKEITASDVTVNKASLEATKASAEKNKEGLEKFVAKSGKSLTVVPSLIKENDYQVGNLQDARSLVRWVFEAKKGEVSEPFSIGEQFVVATLDKILEKGTQDAETAKSGCEAIIRNMKKAAMIKAKIGENATLETAASKYNKTVQTIGGDSLITFNAQIINGVGMEPKIIGAAFNKAYQNKVSPIIEGTTGVFMIKINAIQNKLPEPIDLIAQRNQSKLNTMRSQTNGWFEALKKQADIVDERSKHF